MNAKPGPKIHNKYDYISGNDNKITKNCLFTLFGNFINTNALHIRHVTENGEYNKTGKNAR